jgi:hypothetical protein
MSIGSTISYTYKIYVIFINKPVLSSVLFINSIYILITINTLFSFRLAVYFNNILLMRLWPIRQWLLISFISIKVRFI